MGEGADEFLQAVKRTINTEKNAAERESLRISMSDNWAIDIKDLECGWLQQAFAAPSALI